MTRRAVKHRFDLVDLAGYREGLTFVFLVATFAASILANSHFVDTPNLSFILTNAVEIGLMTLTTTMLIVMGEIDISVGSIIGLSAAVLGQLVMWNVPFALAALLALGAGLLAGLVNGILCVMLRLSSLVVTLTTFILYRGIAGLILKDNTVTAFPTWFMSWDLSRAFWFISWPVIFGIAATIVAILVLHRMRVGRQIYLIGANPLAARYSGLRIDRTKILMFGASGLVSAVAALLLVSRTVSLDNTTGTGLELVVITAVLLGGTDFRGGRGTILGSFMAVALIAVLENSLRLAEVSGQITTAIVGGLLILSIAISAGVAAFQRRARSETPRQQGDRDMVWTKEPSAIDERSR